MNFTRINPIKLLFVLLLFSYASTGQKVTTKKQKITTAAQANTLWIACNPLTLAEPEVSIAFTLLYKKKSIAYLLDAGVFIAHQDYDDAYEDKYKHYRGFRLKPEIKFYPDANEYGPTGLYFSIQGLLKNISASRQDWLPNIDTAGQTSFSQLLPYTEKKTVIGLNALVGGEFFVDNEQRCQVEVYGGLGVRHKNFRAAGIPEGFSKSYNGDDIINRSFTIYRNGFFYSIALGFKVGIRIK